MKIYIKLYFFIGATSYNHANTSYNRAKKKCVEDELMIPSKLTTIV